MKPICDAVYPPSRPPSLSTLRVAFAPSLHASASRFLSLSLSLSYLTWRQTTFLHQRQVVSVFHCSTRDASGDDDSVPCSLISREIWFKRMCAHTCKIKVSFCFLRIRARVCNWRSHLGAFSRCYSSNKGRRVICSGALFVFLLRLFAIFFRVLEHGQIDKSDLKWNLHIQLDWIEIINRDLRAANWYFWSARSRYLTLYSHFRLSLRRRYICTCQFVKFASIIWQLLKIFACCKNVSDTSI